MKKDELQMLEELGREVADDLGPAVTPERLQTQRRAVGALAQTPPRGSGRRRWLISAAATAAVGMLTFVLLETLVPKPMTFWVGDQTRPGEDGAWLEAPKAARLPVRFDDGTRVVLGRESAGRVHAADRKRVRIELARGRVRARVNKRTRSRWTVEAGPYRVTALGTEFTVAWGAGDLLLDVRVRTGKVEVRGPELEPAGVRLLAGDHLQLNREQDRVAMHLRRTPSRSGIPPQPVPEAGIEETPSPTEGIQPGSRTIDRATTPDESPRSTKVATLDGHKPETWEELYDLGRYDDAFAAAERRGFDDLLQDLDDARLWQLADSARFASREDVARRALIALRRRFRKSHRAAIAAFILGRLAVENDDNPREACRWFGIYLSESPGGSLAEEAMGRRIGTCARAGMTAEARRAAEAYLKNYPGGVFAKQAMQAVKGEGAR